MALKELISDWCRVAVLHDTECDLNILHYLGHCIRLMNFSILFINCVCFLCITRYVNPKFLGFLMLSLVDCTDYHVRFL